MRLVGQAHGRDARSSAGRFFKGDVLYGRLRSYLNKVWVAEFDGLCSAEFLVFSSVHDLSSEFLAFRLNAQDFVRFANAQIRGERPRVSMKRLANFRVLLPPRAEQDRIVAKLSSTLVRIERGQAATRRAQQRATRYRDAVLKAAITGELTGAWRQTREAKDTDSREAVLERILTARRATWENAEFKRLQKKGAALKNDRWKSRYREPIKPATTELPALPVTWDVTSLDALAAIGTGLSVSQNREVQDPVELPYLRVANVLRGRLDLAEIKTIQVDRERVHDYLLRQNDILFTEGGDRDKLGRGWIWEGQIRSCVHQNHVFRARLFEPALLNPQFVSYWANTLGQAYFLENAKQTTNLASINREVLRRLPVPVPPVDEQTQILKLVSQRLSSVERLTTSLEHQLARSLVMREALLREAFAGKLVQQDSHDEPADSLPGRIRAERNRILQGRRGTRQIARKQKVRMKRQSREAVPDSAGPLCRVRSN